MKWITNRSIPGAEDSDDGRYRITPIRSALHDRVTGVLLLEWVASQGDGNWQLVARCVHAEAAKRLAATRP